MRRPIPDLLYFQLSKYLSENMGLYFPKERKYDLLKGIRSAAREFGFGDVAECINWLLSTPLTRRQIETLASHLTIGETYFFRELKVFDTLRNKILPPLLKERGAKDRRLRIWSAGCCTGEEPYSIAMLLHSIIPNISEWNITIIATDINPKFLDRAASGVYREWSFRSSPPWIKEKYFSRRKDGTYQLHPVIKKMVKFSYLNLVEDVYPSFMNDIYALDIIFCRNVLLYFNTKQIRRVSERCYNSLLDGGWLIVGSSETCQAYFPQFRSVIYDNAILYQKKKHGVETTKKAVNIQEKQRVDFNVQKIKESVPIKVKDVKVKDGPEVKDLYERAKECYERGLYEETVDILRESISDKKSNKEASILLAKAYANQGRAADALNWCKTAIAHDKLEPQLYYFQALILQEQGRIEEAMDSLKKTLYLDPDFSLAYFQLANLVRRQGRIKEANKYLENAHSLLSRYQKEDLLPHAEGMTAGRLVEIIQLMRNKEIPA